MRAHRCSWGRVPALLLTATFLCGRAGADTVRPERRQLFSSPPPPPRNATKCGACPTGNKHDSSNHWGKPPCNCVPCGKGMKWNRYRGCLACPAGQFNTASTPGKTCTRCSCKCATGYTCSCTKTTGGAPTCTYTGSGKCKIDAGVSTLGVDAAYAGEHWWDPTSWWAKPSIAKLPDSYLGSGKMKSLKTKLEEICYGLLNKLATHQPVCGQSYDSGNYKVNCKKSKWGYTTKAYDAKDLLAVMDICVTPCMQDATRTIRCCMVPQRIASRFPCCRDLKCCPDQDSGRRRRAQAALGSGARVAQVSVAVTVTVEENSASVSVYDALLRCLQNPAKLDAMCLTGSSGH